jgi:hypothetical protein
MTVMPAWAGEVTGAERRWVMRLPVTLAAVVLGLSVATVTLARQQAGGSSEGGQGLRDGQAQADAGTIRHLRAEAARLRAEVEVREIEHEADKAVLLVMLKEAKQALWKQDAVARTVEVQDDAVRANKQRARLAELLRDAEKMRDAFRRQAVGLHEMRFALADLEERLTHTR